MDVLALRNGVWQQVAGAAAASAMAERKDVWIRLEGAPATALDEVAVAIGLHPLAVKDARNTSHRPKVEEYGDQTFVVARVGFSACRARLRARLPPRRLLLFAVIGDQHSRPGRRRPIPRDRRIR